MALFKTKYRPFSATPVVEEYFSTYTDIFGDEVQPVFTFRIEDGYVVFNCTNNPNKGRLVLPLMNPRHAPIRGEYADLLILTKDATLIALERI